MKSGLSEQLLGIFAPIATPFADSEDLDLEALIHNLGLYEGSILRGYLVLGSNGENKSLNETEKTAVLETVWENINKRLTGMALP